MVSAPFIAQGWVCAGESEAEGCPGPAFLGLVDEEAVGRQVPALEQCQSSVSYFPMGKMASGGGKQLHLQCEVVSGWPFPWLVVAEISGWRERSNRSDFLHLKSSVMYCARPAGEIS